MGFGLLFAVVSLMALHLAHQLRQLDADDPVMSFRLFISIRYAGLILSVFSFADHMLGVGL